MISFDNLSFKANAFSNWTVGLNKKDSGYSINKSLINLDLLSGFGRLKFGEGNSFAVDFGTSVHLSIASNLIESLIISKDAKIEANSQRVLKSINAGYQHLLTANSGSGIADLEGTSEVMKKKTLISDEIVFTTSKAQQPVVGPIMGFNQQQSAIYETYFKDYNGKHLATYDEFVSAQTDLKTFRNSLSKERRTAFNNIDLVDTIRLTGLNLEAKVEVQKGLQMKLLELINFEMQEGEYQPYSFKSKEHSAAFKSAFESSQSQSSTPAVVIDTEFKLKANGIELGEILKSSLNKIVVTKIIKGQKDVIPSNLDDFFKSIFADHNGLKHNDIISDDAKKAFLIGELFNKDSITDTKSRVHTVSLIPSFDLTASYGPASFQGISFSSLGVTVSSPVFNIITEYVNSTFTMGINNVSVMPINVNSLDSDGKMDSSMLMTGIDSTLNAVMLTTKSKTMVESLDSIVKSVEPNKSLTSEYSSYLSSDKSSISDYITNNISIKVFAELQKPFMNIFSKGSVYVNKSGDNWLFGLGLITNKSKIDLI